jgi:hypothetical protein
MSPNVITAEELIGHWSHGIAHGYYGGSHDFSLVFLRDGRGAFIHDGWWTYRYSSFRWTLRKGVLVLSDQRYTDPQGFSQSRCLMVAGPVIASHDAAQARERIDVPLVGEPHDYYLLTRDVAEADLHLEHLAAGGGDG